MTIVNSAMLDKFLVDFVNLVCRQISALDPSLVFKMASIAGQVIEIKCTAPEKVWHLIIGANGIELHNGSATHPNVAIAGAAPSLLKALTTGGESAAIQIDGDETLLLELSELIKNFYPDLVLPLALILGDKNANKVAATLELGMSALANLASSLGADAAQNAGAKFAAGFTNTENFARHLDELDALRLRVDRLSAGISQRERTVQDNSEPSNR
jgi:ubiquinone biosynthesis protein UbiJ